MPRQNMVRLITHEAAILEWTVGFVSEWPESFKLKRDGMVQMIREAVDSPCNRMSFLCCRGEAYEPTFDFFKVMRTGKYGETLPVYLERIN